MNELDLCKAMAELECVTVTGILGSSVMAIGFSQGYNPITDLALNCMLRDKYKVDISHEYECAEIQIGSEVMSLIGCDECYVMFGRTSEIPRAVIECILKSKGKL